jgi:type II secretion system protein N
LANIRAEGLQVGDLARSFGITERKISGILDFSGDYKALNSNPGDGNGKGLIQVVSGSISLLQPILNLSTLAFDKLSMSVVHEKGVVQLDEGELLGKEILADFTGELELASPFLTSNVSLSGHLEPDEGFLRSNPQEQQVVQRLLQRYKMTVLPFKVGGTVQRPLFRFST